MPGWVKSAVLASLSLFLLPSARRQRLEIEPADYDASLW
jgi:hypothetical protein